MLNNKIKYPNNQYSGELELVDKELFYICANRRDNWLQNILLNHIKKPI